MNRIYDGEITFFKNFFNKYIQRHAKNAIFLFEYSFHSDTP